MPSVLIAGCGYVGLATADRFHAAGWSVEGWSKSQPQVVRPYLLCSVDISDAAQVRAQSRDFDAIIQCASTHGGDVDLYRSVYLDGARNLAETFPSATILFASSTSVYAQANGEWITEESVTKPARATSQVLLDAERLVLAGGGIVARLGGIYGPGRSALLEKFMRGAIRVETDYFVNQVHRDDIASALFLLLDSQMPGVYNVADGNPLLVSECYRWLAEKLGPQRISTDDSHAARKRGNSNKRVDNAKLRRLGWQLSYPTFAEGMEKSVIPGRGLTER